jgi:hypothetical protein
VFRTGRAIDEFDDGDKDIADLLDDLDIVAQASPLTADAPEDQVCHAVWYMLPCDLYHSTSVHIPLQKDSSLTHTAPVLGGALRLTPTFADSTAFDKLRDVYITHSNMPTSAARSASSDDSLCQVPFNPLQEDPVDREHSRMHSAHQACPRISRFTCCHG